MRSENLPEVRFPGFVNAWEQRQLSGLMKFSNGINAPKDSYGKGRKMISVLDILANKSLVYEDILNSVDVDPKIESNNRVESGDLVFVRSSEIRDEVGWTKAYRQEEYALFSGFSIRGKGISEFDAKFVELSLNYVHRKQIESKAGGSTRFNVSQSILNDVIINVAPIEEQNRIRDFFDKLEKTIALHQQELTTLKQTKLGFVQKMFPKEGEFVPEVRFPGFSGEWEVRRIGEISDSFSGGTPSAGNKLYYGGNIPFIRSAEINSLSTELYITEDGLENSSAKMVKRGDILYAMYGATSGEVGISRIQGAINQAILAIRPKMDKDSYFIAEWLKKQKNEITGKYLQGGQGNLSGSIVKDIEILIPNNVTEQALIGNFFKHLDETIALQEKELEALQQTKKAFLQKMFV